ncbi:MAG: AAA family ATPase [Acidiferrobacterales bacterium]|nr:AAA family ATPase [Acidiferrobacterales bacterium]
MHAAETEPLERAIAEVEQQLETLHTDREAAEMAYQTAEAESRAAQERLSQASVAAVEARNHYDNLQRDRDRTQQEIGAMRQRAEDRQSHLAMLQETIGAASEKAQAFKDELGAVRAGRSGLDENVSKAKTALMQVKVDLNTIENTLRKLRQEREARIRDEHTRAVRRAELKTRAHDLLENIQTDFGLSLAEDRIEIDADFDDASARSEVKDLRQRIASMGNVNALALEEYDEERERLEFMTTQRQDLENAESTLLETIDQINTTAAARFDETYEAIRTNFRSLFAELFGEEATADLELADPKDPLESPIEIMAKPRGKRPVSIAQLSSGEKTLTAIALLFAIYLVKPSPFCLLDEVDAPLDDANVDRYMKLIRRFSDETQFILVTHNKRTMELADRLYGITMQEQGVSRLVGVKFDEALAMAG